MKHSLRIALILLASISVCSAQLKSVSFSNDTVTEVDGKIIKFRMGSTWVMEKEIVALPLNEGVIICAGPAPEFNKDKIDDYVRALPSVGILFYRGQMVNINRLDGLFLLRNGFLGNVVEQNEDGAILKTDDGSHWAIPQYDRYDTGFWLPPYPVLIFDNQQYLINLKKGKKVWVEKKTELSRKTPTTEG